MNYLVVTKWDALKDISIKTTSRIKFDMNKSTELRGTKGRELSLIYEKELNGGLEFLDKCEDYIINKKEGVLYSVCYQPYNECREYINFRQWENCEEYKETNDI